MSDLRVLAALADGLGRPLGFRTAAQAAAELAELGAGPANGPPPPTIGAAQPSVSGEQTGNRRWCWPPGGWRWTTAAAVAGEPYLLQTAGRPVAVLSPATARAAGVGERVTVTNDRGSITLPVELVESMVRRGGLGADPGAAALGRPSTSARLPVSS